MIGIGLGLDFDSILSTLEVGELVSRVEMVFVVCFIGFEGGDVCGSESFIICWR